ncbi:hypothetical protein KsCSTR_25840 [Candidatus Kuenenia stuttgartiensis]|uniref:Uncharacterized protein n=1 Tax=Kuenenia stuttgartiensis TaxID=174633 RepID=Q1Q737_KUEST|nr:hypothetical protein KsCSTR_25840 [Candidatus Kuenenia stuttgartiensis]CAJ73395.1 unknown protein [Candidatus Kuenenia stuttgartiensis]
MLFCGLCCPSKSNATTVSSELLAISHYLIILRLTGLCRTDLYWLIARFSLIYSALLCLRVAIHTPTDLPIAFGCCFISNTNFHHLCSGSVSVSPPLRKFYGGLRNEVAIFPLSHVPERNY